MEFMEEPPKTSQTCLEVPSRWVWNVLWGAAEVGAYTELILSPIFASPFMLAWKRMLPSDILEPPNSCQHGDWPSLTLVSQWRGQVVNREGKINGTFEVERRGKEAGQRLHRRRWRKAHTVHHFTAHPSSVLSHKLATQLVWVQGYPHVPRRPTDVESKNVCPYLLLVCCYRLPP